MKRKARRSPLVQEAGQMGAKLLAAHPRAMIGLRVFGPTPPIAPTASYGPRHREPSEHELPPASPEAEGKVADCVLRHEESLRALQIARDERLMARAAAPRATWYHLRPDVDTAEEDVADKAVKAAEARERLAHAALQRARAAMTEERRARLRGGQWVNVRGTWRRQDEELQRAMRILEREDVI